MKKYGYEVVDSKGKLCSTLVHNRAIARESKMGCYMYPLPGECPPYKIVRYELTNPTVIR